MAAAKFDLPSSDACVELCLLDGGSFVGDLSRMHAGQNGTFRMYNWAFYIARKGRKVLWDLGLDDDRSCYTPWVNKFMLDYVNHVGPRQTIVQQLSDRGVAAEDVDTVLFSHAHFDHSRPISNVFPNAKAYFGPGTRAACEPGHMKNPDLQWDGRFFDPDNATEDWGELNGDWKPFGPFEKALDYFGDGSFWVLSAPGHMAGNLAAAARLQDGEWVILGSDLTMVKKYDLPGVFYLDLWPIAWGQVVITDPDLALHMTAHRNHPKHPAEGAMLDPLIGKGNIVTSDGLRWKHLHKMLSPAFSISHITKMRPMVATEVMKFRSILHKKAGSGESFRLEDITQHLTFDVIVSATFGRSLDAQTKGSTALQHFEDMCRAYMISRESINFVRNFFANRKRDFEKAKLDANIAALVTERFEIVRRDNLDLSEKRGLGIMDLILRDYLADPQRIEATELDPMFLEDAVTQVKTLLLAGTGTTSDTVVFGAMLLSVHPDVVRKMREEHDRVFTPGIDATYEMLKTDPYKLNELVYTNAVVKEILRFYPIGNTAREGIDTLTYQGREWPAKDLMVCPVQLAMHMDPKLFNDPLKFDPDRFIREDFPRHAWRPFERGPRACLGQPLAMDEVLIIFLLITRDFDFTCADLKPNKTPRVEWFDLDLTFGDRAFQEFVFEAKPRDGMPMTVKKEAFGSDQTIGVMFTSPRSLSALLFAAGVYAQYEFPDCANGPLSNETICDTSASPLARAKSLVALYSLEEKINATSSGSPGVARLGIPPYQWWNEGLHGIAGPYTNFSDEGDYSYSTSFPQPILMGAAFDDELITEVAKVISTEARAFNNANRTGLDFWTPNINPFRDPRWGRGQETPGEDSYHLASYVQALIHGLQGDASDPYKRVVATCKHYAGYDIEDWNGNFRYQNDVQISQQDLVEYYLVPFQACVQANVGAIMCSYNALNGVPTCADPYMLQTILREHWGWTNEEQWVTSDCDSIQNVYLPHQWSSSREGAAADSLNAGTDLDCGTYMQEHLPAAFQKGLTNETSLDQALIRQYSSLVRLGYFDSAENQPYRQLDFDAVATNDSQALARKAAGEGIVLLKNDGTLPLSLDSSMSIGLFGDWANATDQLLGNYAGVPTFLHSPLYALEQLDVTVNYAGGNPGGQGDPTTNRWSVLSGAIATSDVLMYVGGMDNGVEAEDQDRDWLTWTGAQLDVIGQLAETGKPVIVVVTGGGQIDSSPLVNNPNISAILWAGYPGQDGGSAIIDIVTGKVAPAGRLPQTQYPSKYVAEVPMTDMSMRPGEHNPGRTYKWYNGSAIYEFGHGLHYTNFSAQIKTQMQDSYSISALVHGCNSTGGFLERCPFASVDVSVSNDGHTASDYVTLGYIGGTFGPAPCPKKSLVSYKRLFGITGGASETATLNLTLASLARVDEMGNKVLYPGDYSLMIDNQPLAMINFTLTGDDAMLSEWPQPPANRTGKGVKYYKDYWVGGYGSSQGVM
ncbi:glycoside hydrolase family 3 protein [Stemphylium lycopersici]|nr:glycoside hydrolase family 3 protein [Stemphylium lycopersici]